MRVLQSTRTIISLRSTSGAAVLQVKWIPLRSLSLSRTPWKRVSVVVRYASEDITAAHLKNKQGGKECQIAAIHLGMPSAGFVARAWITTTIRPQLIDEVPCSKWYISCWHMDHYFSDDTIHYEDNMRANVVAANKGKGIVSFCAECRLRWFSETFRPSSNHSSCWASNPSSTLHVRSTHI